MTSVNTGSLPISDHYKMSSEAEASAAANSTNVEELKPVVELKNSAGRVSGKGWKMERMATRWVGSHCCYIPH